MSDESEFMRRRAAQLAEEKKKMPPTVPEGWKTTAMLASEVKRGGDHEIRLMASTSLPENFADSVAEETDKTTGALEKSGQGAVIRVEQRAEPEVGFRQSMTIPEKHALYVVDEKDEEALSVEDAELLRREFELWKEAVFLSMASRDNLCYEEGSGFFTEEANIIPGIRQQMKTWSFTKVRRRLMEDIKRKDSRVLFYSQALLDEYEERLKGGETA